MIAKKFGGQDNKLNHHFALKIFNYESASDQIPKKHYRSSYHVFYEQQFY